MSINETFANNRQAYYRLNAKSFGISLNTYIIDIPANLMIGKPSLLPAYAVDLHLIGI